MYNKQCPVCGNDMKKAMQLKFGIYECKKCKLLESDVSNRAGAALENVDESARAHALKDLRMFNFNFIINNLLTTHPKAYLEGLEVGCAHGWFVEACRPHKSISIMGIEPQKEYMEYLSPDEDVLHGFFPEDLPADKSFDFIIFNDVFEHLPDVSSILTACYDFLNRDGLLILNIPLSSGFIFKMSKLLSRFLGSKKFLNRLWQFDYVTPHMYYFNKRNLTRLCEKTGFKLANYHRLDVLRKGSVRSRADLGNTKMNSLSLLFAEALLPLLKYAPEDCGCFYFRKQ